MANLPPELPSNYPRQAVNLGPSLSADKLQLLIEGYFGLNYIFLLNVLLYALPIGFRLFSPVGALVGYFCMAAIVGMASYPSNRKITRGSNQPDGIAVAFSILVFVFGWLCCGIVAYAIIQTIAGKEMKKYGLKTSFSLTKKKGMMVVEQLRVSEAMQAQSGAYPRPPM